jgi:uncharacterized protein YggE
MSMSQPARIPASPLRWLAFGAAAGMLVAAAVLPGLGSHSALAVDPTSTIEHTISVSGTGRVVLTPDVADLSLGVSITRPTAAAARQDAADAMTKVVDAIKKGGVADADIQTSSLSLQPVYDYSNNGQGKLTGFQLTNIVSVTVHKLDAVGNLVDAAVAAGATSVNGVTFRVDNQTAAEGQARTAAVKDARSKADALASAAGVTIVGVSSISETSAPIPYPIAFAAGAPAKDASTPIQPGTTEIDVTVSITYRIG